MDVQDNQLYARSFADVYDAWYSDLDDPAHLIASVRRRTSASATVLELGSGTGRLAVPLHQAGFHVLGLDSAANMLADAAPGPLPIGADMTAIPLCNQSVDVVVIAYNTLFNVAPTASQQQCIAEAARVLRPDGFLAIEAFIAPTDDASGDQTRTFGISSRPHPIDPDAVLSIVSGPHASEPGVIVGAHIERSPHTICRPWQLTYQNPEQLDASASNVGLDQVDRFSDWADTAFTPNDHRHVTWYKRR